MTDALKSSRQNNLAGYESAFENMLVSPANAHDPFFPLFAQAALDLVERDTAVQDELVIIRQLRQERNPDESFGYIGNLLLREIQYGQLAKELQQPDEKKRVYPDDYDSEDAWRGLIRTAVVRPDPYYSQNPNLYLREVQSNVDVRYVNPKILAMLYPGRMDPRPRILDIGSSSNHGLKRLALAKEFPFQEVTALDSPFGRARKVDEKIHEADTAAIRYMINRPFSIGKSLGVDRLPTHLSSFRLWVKACSFYPSEFQDKTAVQRFDEIDRVESDTVSFAQADCTVPKDMALAVRRRKAFDIVMFSTMLYQLNQQQREVALELGEKMASDRGFVVVLDSVDASRTSGTGLRFPVEFYNNQRRPFGYKLIVKDMQDPDAGFQELLRWENGRCSRIIPNRDHTVVENALERVKIAIAKESSAPGLAAA